MALQGLFLAKVEGKNMNQNLDLKFPKLGDMLNYILQQQPKLLDSTELREQKLLFPSMMYVVMIKFLLKCFEAELEQKNSSGRESELHSSVETMCALLEHALAYEGSVELHANASKALISIASHIPKVISYISHI